MKGSYRTGTYRVEWDANTEMLLSPDRTQQLLPCEKCGVVVWVPLNVVTYICPPEDPCVLEESC